jgi:hypothetical protein
LEPAAKQAVEAYAESWSVKVSDEVRKVLNQQPKMAAMILDQNLAQAGMLEMPMPDWLGNVDRPPDQEVWIKALHQTLNPDQAAAWDKEETDRKAGIEKEIAFGVPGN